LVQKAAWSSTPAKQQQAPFIPNTPLHIRQLVAAKKGLEESGKNRVMQTTSTSITDCPDT